MQAIDADDFHRRNRTDPKQRRVDFVAAGGSIAGGAEGVFAENCSVKTLSNHGAIGGAADGGVGVLTNSGRTIDLLTNASGATISGGSGIKYVGAGVSNSGAITTLTNSGKITGGFASGYTGEKATGGAGVSDAGTIRTLINSGAISGGASFSSGSFILRGRRRRRV